MNVSRRPRPARTVAVLGLASLALAGLAPAASAAPLRSAPPVAAVAAPSTHGHDAGTTTASGLRDPDGNVVVVDPWRGDVSRETRASGAVAAALDLGSSAAAAPKAKKKLTTLVVPVYWSGAGKDKVTTKKLKTMMKKTDAYFRTVSDGRIGHSSKVLGWVKISKPPVSCGLSPQMGHLISQVDKAAKKKGIKTSKYHRIVTYVTSKACARQTPPEAGLASIGGRYTWLNGFIDVDVVTHELGHNLGLEHANYAECASSKTTRISFGKSTHCSSIEYGDTTDTMGAYGINGWFSGPRLSYLGWLTKSQLKANSSTKKKSYSLVPVATAAKGVKAVKIKASRYRTYWIEYRTATGLDKALEAEGIQVRVTDPMIGQGGTRSAILDMYPTASPKDRGGFNLSDWNDVTLRPGSSWTSPEGIQIAFSTVASGKAKVTVTRKAKAKKPAAPSKVTAVNGDTRLRVTWARPADKGMPITAYRLTATSASGATKTTTIASPGGTVTSGVVKGLTNGQTYTVSVQAVSEKGTSAAGTSTGTKVAAILPRPVILSPAAGTVVGKTLTVKVRADEGVGALSRLTEMYACLDAAMELACEYAYDFNNNPKAGKTGTMTFDTTWLSSEITDGPATIYVALVDDAGRVGKATRQIVLERAGQIEVPTLPDPISEGSTFTVRFTPRPGIPDDYPDVRAVVTYTHPEEGRIEAEWYPTPNDDYSEFTFTWDAWMVQNATVATTVPATIEFRYTSNFLAQPRTVTRTTHIALPSWG